MVKLGAAIAAIFKFLTSPTYAKNDYELAIKTSKDLEHLLEQEWGADGKGLHEKITWVQHSDSPLPDDLMRRMRFLATIRNKLIHDITYTRIEDRARFIETFERSKRELHAILVKRGKKPGPDCAIM
ncbi:hypothetical protein NSK_001195 [Nannochloropsis salina CCMP1776]|jgi:hypothetical protein|uniref:DUF4145 domain-containing protein n=1 Tax=Nannochloropsis salina CCMP1776 TaxID=1027361 RepID=A0A4D9DGA7_9STRA|nr:hypothetical protein NSK_001195 [Nannochloropsis salina CCMP1776]|eukprot:TFJ87848.1 hypothetical protein NSK_001195 [Nannochloropsis salina CCMP1776]